MPVGGARLRRAWKEARPRDDILRRLDRVSLHQGTTVDRRPRPRPRPRPRLLSTTSFSFSFSSSSSIVIRFRGRGRAGVGAGSEEIASRTISLSSSASFESPGLAFCCVTGDLCGETISLMTLAELQRLPSSSSSFSSSSSIVIRFRGRGRGRAGVGAEGDCFQNNLFVFLGVL